MGTHGQILPKDEKGNKDKQIPPLESKDPMDARDTEDDDPNSAVARKEGAPPKPLLAKKKRKPGKEDAEVPQNPVSHLFKNRLSPQGESMEQFHSQ